MTIGAHILGQIDLDDTVHILDVQTACGKVGGNEELCTPRADRIEGSTPLVAPLAAEQSGDADALILQLLHGFRRIEAASDKDKSPTNRQAARQFLHSLYFITK